MAPLREYEIPDQSQDAAVQGPDVTASTGATPTWLYPAIKTGSVPSSNTTIYWSSRLVEPVGIGSTIAPQIDSLQAHTPTGFVTLDLAHHISRSDSKIMS